MNSNIVSFIDDAEKMRDFFALTKAEFLASYSYLSGAEYDATLRDVASRVIDLLIND